eukprot:scaffold38787_cov73-Cyclotella_meneghiniana.AAC.10
MCTKRRGKIRRSSMVEEVPVKYSKELDLNSENSSQCPVSNTKPSVVKEIIKTLLILASIFSVFLLKRNTSVFRFNTPSRVSLLSEIDHLKHDLESYERLKKQLADKEVQLKWDRQHIQESEEIVNGVVTSSQDLTFDIEEALIVVKHEQEEIAELRRQIAITMKDLIQQNIDIPKDLFDRLDSLHKQ